MSLQCLDTSVWFETTHAKPNAARFSKCLEKSESIINSTVRIHNAALWTQDVGFDRLPHVRYFPQIKQS